MLTRKPAIASPDEYFVDQATRSNPEFWRRFGARPEFAGKRVLDFGCGQGAMALEMARDGADVLAIDLAEDHVAWGQMRTESEQVPGRLEFRVGDVTRMGFTDEFDVIVSKDSFEHIADLGTVLRTLRTALKPEGRLWAGFSPLYYSPFGDHARTGMRLAWLHTLPQPLVRAVASRVNGRPVRSLDDLGLNGMEPAQFRDLVKESGLRFESLLYNQGDKPLLRTLDRARRVRWLERYATVSIYAVLARV